MMSAPPAQGIARPKMPPLRKLSGGGQAPFGLCLLSSLCFVRSRPGCTPFIRLPDLMIGFSRMFGSGCEGETGGKL